MFRFVVFAVSNACVTSLGGIAYAAICESPEIPWLAGQRAAIGRVGGGAGAAPRHLTLANESGRGQAFLGFFETM